MTHKLVNGVSVPLSSADLALLAQMEAAAPEKQWAVVRAERNALLAASDWTQVADAPVDAAAWRLYRQALRDVTLQENPFNIVWPTRP